MIRLLNNAVSLFCVKTAAACLFVLVLPTGFSGESHAQSFSCANAQIPSEFTICNNEDLILLDEQLAELFADARVTVDNNSAIQKISDSHGQWLRERNSCKIDFGCLLESYRDRIKVLEKDGKQL